MLVCVCMCHLKSYLCNISLHQCTPLSHLEIQHAHPGWNRHHRLPAELMHAQRRRDAHNYLHSNARIEMLTKTCSHGERCTEVIWRSHEERCTQMLAQECHTRMDAQWQWPVMRSLMCWCVMPKVVSNGNVTVSSRWAWSAICGASAIHQHTGLLIAKTFLQRQLAYAKKWTITQELCVCVYVCNSVHRKMITSSPPSRRLWSGFLVWLL